jgi:hypothetical protein
MVNTKFIYSAQNVEQQETIKKVKTDYYEQVFINRWCKLPLGLLNGKTPTEAAKDPAYKIRLLGAIQVIENWLNEEIADSIANQLRKKLGLPEYGAITIPVGAEEEELAALNNYPIWRWHRFEVEKLPAAFLVEGLQIAATLKRRLIIKKFALEILSRPTETIPISFRALAFESLIELERETNHFETALEWIEKAKQEINQTNFSSASFLLNELVIRITLQQAEKANEIIREIFTKYGNDETVLKVLQTILVQFGVINPDGSLPETFLQGNAVGNSNKIWAPETIAGNENRSKLWIPEG